MTFIVNVLKCVNVAQIVNVLTKRYDITIALIFLNINNINKKVNINRFK